MGIVSFLKKIRNEFLRKVKYRHYKIGPNFYSGIRVRIWGKQRIEIGKNFYIGRDSFIETDVVIGNNVIMANRTAIVGRYDHHYQQIGVPTRLASQIRDADYNWHGLNSLTIIENDVWVGYGSTILSGVTIKTGSVIAAGSVVTKDVDAYSIYAGVPAKKVRNRFECQDDLDEHIRLSAQKGYI
ncbi:acyltransferase [Mucilaginibacter aquatilis]|uniref:Acyltransferase n=1 Tax=Mucilaginibacter aquatilis TaxID=1517760 RepID=A0A6I4IAX5_9SPHI|nr:DapH/DapD/GlmU-related protein [Mucilaginibacter aquatilis]MVN90609.1 acyltransferase [Mucilaginibacter aquatilis]